MPSRDIFILDATETDSLGIHDELESVLVVVADDFGDSQPYLLLDSLEGLGYPYVFF